MPKNFSLLAEIKQKLQILLATNQALFDDIKALQNKFNMPWKKEITTEEYFYLHQETAKLRKKHKLSEAFDFPLLEYLAKGKLKETEEKSYLPFFTENRLTGENYLVIQIFAETSIKDLQKAWPEIKKKRESLLEIDFKKRAKRKKLERDLRILELKKQGKKSVEITQLIKQEFSERIGYQDISKIIQRLQ